MLAWFWLCLLPPSSAPGQGPATGSEGEKHRVHRIGEGVSSRPPTSTRLADQIEERESLYAELAEEFALVERLGNLVKRVATLVKPSVIHIEARKLERHHGRSEAFDEAGAGVAVKIAGQTWVLTNRHVIAGAELSEIVIRTSDGQKCHPLKVLSDPSTDVAVMQIDAAIPLAKIGDSEQADIGDFVIAIGSPFGLSHSVTFGILSARGRRDLTLGSERIELQDFFQTDAAINPGNSGGPLINLRGEVIAINTAIASSSGGSEGIGFAIPIAMAVRVAEELVKHGQLRRGYLGVTLDPEFSPAEAIRVLGSPHGALVKEVRAGSPADLARIRRGDVILEFDGAKIESDDHLVTRVGLTPINHEVPLVISRNGQRYRTVLVVTPVP
ncbi:MAG: PDZ domain-containing protein [Planctomycetaceae bacterium]|nr:MAG: PDZ domain-containing protein [Planctomycetaceae bacterium]